MEIPVYTVQMVVGKKKTKSTDGKTDYYSVAIATEDGDAGSINCDEKVYEDVELFKTYRFDGVYREGSYRVLRFLRAALINDDASKQKASNNKG